jgi:hypothetical protein
MSRPNHIMMRRYRYSEEDLTVRNPETDQHVDEVE